MKRLLPFIPVLLFLLVNSCTSAYTSPNPNDIATAIALTKTAEAWQALPTPTFNIYISTMVSGLNMDLTTTNSLGATIDADYHVNNISFRNSTYSQDLIIRVDVGCTCMHRTDCCTPERAFVVIIASMKKSFPLERMPPRVDQMLVVCTDQRTKSPIGAISVSWQDILHYIGGSLDGHQLGVKVIWTAAP